MPPPIAATFAGGEPCPICRGVGELTYIDEEVGCQIGVPCWACAGPAEEHLGQPASDTPWPG
jgi:hypothetical protein